MSVKLTVPECGKAKSGRANEMSSRSKFVITAQNLSSLLSNSDKMTWSMIFHHYKIPTSLHLLIRFLPLYRPLVKEINRQGITITIHHM